MKKSLETRLYQKASKAMQDYYRSIGGECLGKGKSCHGRMELMHHHSRWGQSVALRFEQKNLVPLCQPCHMAYHNGNYLVKTNYERAMKYQYGHDWEDVLLELDRNAPHRTRLEKIEYLKELINNYKI